MTELNVETAERVVKLIARRERLVDSYRAYWVRLKPVSHAEYADRWTFAITSMVNTWENNCRSYLFVAALGHPLHRLGEQGLLEKLKESRCGCHARRAAALYQFSEAFWRRPSDFYPQKKESLVSFRDRLSIRGMGPAKLAFVLEMLLPGSCEVTCVDRHMLGLYGLEKESSVSPAVYRAIESHWAEACGKQNLPAPIARHVWWDQQRAPVMWSTRYWSHVLEDPARREAGYYEVLLPGNRRPLKF